MIKIVTQNISNQKSKTQKKKKSILKLLHRFLLAFFSMKQQSQYTETKWLILNNLRRFIFLQLHVVNSSSTKRCTVMILSFRTDMPGQTAQTQIRLLLEEQSDQGLHCLLFRLHRLDSLLYGRATYLKF